MIMNIKKGKRGKNMEISKLTRKQLLDLISSYNNYVMSYFEEHDMGQCPVSIYEYYDNEYQEMNVVDVQETDNDNKQTFKDYLMETYRGVSIDDWEDVNGNYIIILLNNKHTTNEFEKTIKEIMTDDNVDYGGIEDILDDKRLDKFDWIRIPTDEYDYICYEV